MTSRPRRISGRAVACPGAERGLLERDPVTERYRIGFGLVRLAGAAIGGVLGGLIGNRIGAALDDEAEATLQSVLKIGPDDASMLTILTHGTEYQKEKFLKPLLNGDKRICYSMTEKAAGAATNASSTPPPMESR